MGRRKIEIKAIKDDRNRSVTFLKRKGGLFKKAHELSVLCSVDVAVFIFGTNKKLYEYSSTDMNKLIQRYHFHGGPNEHKGPSDFNGGNDEEEEDDEHGTPPQRESMEPQMMPPHFPGQAPYQHMTQHEPSASPPINGMPFQHPGHPGPRGHTPQPQIGSRPASRQDIRRMNQPPPPQQPVNGYAYMPNPAIYNPQAQQGIQGGMPQQGPQYQYQQHAQHAQPQPPPPPPPHMQQYMDEQRRSAPPTSYPQAPQVARVSPSPPQPPTLQLPQQQQQQQPPHVSPPPLPPQHLSQQAPPPEGAMLAPMEPVKPEFRERPTAPLLNTDSAIKKMPQRKQHSIFTPIDENRSILSQHFASFAAPDSSKGETPVKVEPGAQREAESRSQSTDAGARSTSLEKTSSPPAAPQSHKGGRGSVSTIPETGFTPPSRSNTGGARPLLRLEIPDEPSDGGGSATAASDTHSPRANAEPAATNASRRPDGQASNSMVLPPPSPSGPPLLSAGATGPPNPFARPAPQQQSNGVNIDTPVSALPSRFMNNDFLPSPSSFDPYWSYRGGNDNNTLPSPLNFATPVVGSGPSFLREEISSTTGKRKTPDPGLGGPSEGHDSGHDSGGDAKRAKVDA